MFCFRTSMHLIFRLVDIYLDVFLRLAGEYGGGPFNNVYLGGTWIILL